MTRLEAYKKQQMESMKGHLIIRYSTKDKKAEEHPEWKEAMARVEQYVESLSKVPHYFRR